MGVHGYKQTHTHTLLGPCWGRGGFLIKVASISPMSYCKGRALGQRGCSHGRRALLRASAAESGGWGTKTDTAWLTAPSKERDPRSGEQAREGGEAISRDPEGREETQKWGKWKSRRKGAGEHRRWAEVQW